MRCAVCGSERLSPLGEVRTGKDWGDVPILRFYRPKFFSPRPTYRFVLGRGCRDCGALQMFLTDYDRKLLNEEADGLEDVRSDM
ncbi:hypothetical protein GCM10009839_21470 [Catenulispora yoronensis]|uniref:Uncharacterized protein n=1 Tax=Catenulispora yoronensis TaxID=450799 RepID=A0ABN2TWQ3_9ACTN